MPTAMTIHRLLFPLLALLLPGCKSASHSATSTADSTTTSTVIVADDPAGNWYKRFSGNLAGKQIVVQLQRYNGHVQGSYQYTAVGEAIQLTNWEDTDNNPLRIHLNEFVAGANSEGDEAVWTLDLNDNAATGEWKRGSSQYALSLREEYPEGSTRLKALYNADSAALFPGRATSPGATISRSYLMPPEGANNDFLYNAMRAQMWPNSRRGDDIAALIHAADDRYFGDYRRDNAGEASSPDEDDFTLRYSSEDVISVLYNDSGWLVTEDFSSDYTGGAHGNYGSSYANIDRSQTRVWTVTDVLADTIALRPFLAEAAIRFFNLKPGDRMEDRLLVDAVPPTANFFLSGTGLTMVYNPYEIASYADGQVKLFIPYRRIQALLTPAFRSRMGISDKRGVAVL